MPRFLKTTTQNVKQTFSEIVWYMPVIELHEDLIRSHKYFVEFINLYKHENNDHRLEKIHLKLSSFLISNHCLMCIEIDYSISKIFTLTHDFVSEGILQIVNCMSI